MRSYQLDKSDKLVATEGDWDAFSQENGGAENTQDAYIGRPLWDFVTGFETQSYLNTLFFFVRQKQEPLELVYRCDSENTARAFSMRIEPLAENGLSVSHIPLRVPAPRPQSEAIQLRSYLERPVLCSQCLKMRMRKTWVESFGLPNLRDIPVKYDVCPSCRNAAHGAMTQPVGQVDKVVVFGR